MRRLSFCFAVLALLVIGAGHVQGAIIDFEGLAHYELLDDQYLSVGADFGGNANILKYPHYNYTGYPPHSGDNVAFNPTNSAVRIDAVGPAWASASLWYSAGNWPVSLDAYNAGGTMVDSDSGPANYGSNTQLSVAGSAISYVIVHDQGNYFTFDDLEFEQIPEPASLIVWSLLGALGITVGWWRRRRRGADWAGGAKPARTPWPEENRTAILEIINRGGEK